MQLAPVGLLARPLDFDDVAALQALLGACAEYFRRADGAAPNAHAAMERIADAAGDEASALFGFWDERELVAMLEVRIDEPDPAALTIVLLLVHPSRRGRGAGRIIVDALERAHEGPIHLGVADGDEAAHAFWRALDFHAERARDGVTNYVRRH